MVNYNLKAIHMKVLLITFIFCLISGFYEALAPVLPLILNDLGYTSIEIGFIIYILSVLVFILDSAVFFAILYLSCRRNFMENIASIVISLIVGTVVGVWVGGLLGLFVKFYRPPTSPSIFTIGVLLSEFGACSAAYLNTKWDRLTSKVNMSSEKPFGVVLISGLHIVLSLLTTFLILMLLGLSNIGFDVIFSKIFLFLPLAALLSVLSVAYFFIAYRFYKGRRWAWFAVFAFSLIGMLLLINQLIFAFQFGILFILRIVMLLIDVSILIYLVQLNVRMYFGVVNPASES